MRRVPVDDQGGAVAEAARVLREGGIVAFPTETVYGLCADAANAEAVERLYAAKGRDRDRACAHLLADRAAADALCGGLPELAARLADAFWPGPVTLVVPGEDGAALGLRVPSDETARALARAAGGPLLQTSANRSGAPPARDAEAVAALGDAVDLVLDAGPAPGGEPSTVVRCGRRLEILREGAVGEAAILEAAERLYLVACTGNICRSPVAEAMLRRLVAERLGGAEEELAWGGFRFGSFGVMAGDGYPASERSVEAAAELGYDVSAHRSRPFSIGLVRAAHRVYWLDRSHEAFLAPYFEERRDALQPLDPDGKDIADPIGRSARFHRKTAARIEQACRARAERLVAGGE